MTLVPLVTTGSAIGSAFLASLVEVVEAFTIVLAVATVRGWRPAVIGALSGLAVLAALVLAAGPLLGRVPLHLLQFTIGVLLLLFGLRWLKKAILRASHRISFHDEEAAFAEETAELLGDVRERKPHLDWLAGLAAFKAVLLEGIEVVFIVIAVGAGHGVLVPASLGAVAACVLVLLIGFLIHKPLSRVPENSLKFIVGVMLSAFGTFWVGEGLRVEWSGGDLAVLGLALLYFTVAVGIVRSMRLSTERGAI